MSDLLTVSTPATTTTPDAGATSQGAPSGGGVTMPAFNEAVPAEYHDRGWYKDTSRSAEPWKAYFSQFDNAQKKLSERVEGLQVPGADATPEATKAFYKALGVPDNADGYDYKAPDLSKEPDGVKKFFESNKAGDEAFLSSMKTKALELGMTPKQFNEMAAAFDNFQMTSVKNAIEATAANNQAVLDKQMETFKSIYGADADKVRAIAKATAEKVIPENIRNTKDVEIALHHTLKFIHEKLYANDTIGTIDGNPTPGDTVESITKQIQEIRSKPEYKSSNTSKVFQDLDKQVNVLYKKREELRSNKQGD